MESEVKKDETSYFGSAGFFALIAVAVSGCVIRDDFHHGSRWHHWG
jgi:hypothetical protein